MLDKIKKWFSVLFHFLKKNKIPLTVVFALFTSISIFFILLYSTTVFMRPLAEKHEGNVGYFYQALTNNIYYIHDCNGEVICKNSVRIPNGNTKNSKLIHTSYLASQNGVFIKDALIPDANKDSFKLITESGYAADGEKVFFLDKLVEGADVDSFQVIKKDDLPKVTEISIENETSYPNIFAYDIENVYFRNKLLLGAEANEWEILDLTLNFKKINDTEYEREFVSSNQNSVLYSRDTKKAFYKEKVINTNSPDFLFPLTKDYDYATDLENVYYRGELIVSANAGKVQVLHENLITDEQRIFYQDEVLENFSLENFSQVFCKQYKSHPVFTNGAIKISNGQEVKDEQLEENDEFCNSVLYTEI